MSAKLNKAITRDSIITGLIANLVAMGFLIWGLADLWFKRDGVLAIYIIAFVITCICLVGFILLFIFVNRGNEVIVAFINFFIDKLSCLSISTSFEESDDL